MIESARSFPPLEGVVAHTLILGTAPGQASLSAAQYYAHPRNAFWPIMLGIVNNTPANVDTVNTVGYDERCSTLTDNGYAIWDVLAYCDRPGSLDSRIVRASEIPNAIAALIDRHPELHTLACNGRTAEKLFARHIELPTRSQPIRVRCLPSSSPAMASLSLQQKHQLWAEGLLG